MTSLADFLLARIAEDEAVALAATPGPWAWDEDGDLVSTEGEHLTVLSGTVYIDIPYLGLDPEPGDATHVARWDPARVLAECDAKRQIVERYRWVSLAVADDRERGYLQALDLTLRLLALPYADHPDYQQEWKL